MNWNQLFTKNFIVMAVILTVLLAGFHFMLEAIGAVLMKEAVPLRLDLSFMSESFGPYALYGSESKERWKQGPNNTKREVIDELGTEKFITWTYKDNTLTPRDPGYLIQMHVAYYTGVVDNVPHIPEHCIVATGAEIKATSHLPVYLTRELDPDWEQVNGTDLNLAIEKDRNGNWYARSDNPMLGKLNYRNLFPHGRDVNLPAGKLDIRAVTFSKVLPDGNSDEWCEMYFFVANGQFLKNAMEVRKNSFSLKSTHAYYCKIQLTPMRIVKHPVSGLAMAAPLQDVEQARQAVQKYLSYALPEILVCLPDWNEVMAGRYPLSRSHAKPSEKTDKQSMEKSNG